MWLLVNCKNGVSSCEIARDIGVTQKTAWFTLHRLRLAIHAKSFDKMSGSVEVDETFIGGQSAEHVGCQARRYLSASVDGRQGCRVGLWERHPEKGMSRIRSTASTVAVGITCSAKFTTTSNPAPT